MTQKKWERTLKRFLSPLPKSEQKSIVAYYREMYQDKLDLGLSESEILAEFGDPQVCAGRMIAESSIEQKTPPTTTATNNPFAQEYKAKPIKSASVGGTLGMVFFTLLLGIPVGAVWVSVIAVFAAVGVASVAVGFAGLLSPLLTPFYSSLGFSGVSFAANLGLYLASAGAGFMLAVLFYYATKHTVVGLIQTVKFIYGRYRL